MKTRLIGIAVAVGLTLAVATTAIAQDAQLTSPVDDPLGEHCVVYLKETGGVDAQGFLQTTHEDLGCYSTFSEAISVGTNGAVELPAAMQPSELTEGALITGYTHATEDGYVPAGRVVISVEYRQVEMTGQSLTYVTKQGCSEPKGVAYKDAQLSLAWNDKISSAKGYGGCNRVKHFRHAAFGGDVEVCRPGCAHMGFMNNQTSSIKWRNEL